MREIKFRAWHKNNGFMYTFDISSDGKLSYDGGPMVAVIEQYTGLKDKNGREIYEGDILSWSNPGYVVKIPEIYYAKESIDSYYNYPYSFEEHCEVIGNIHENADMV